jgi:hypothetical protein
MLGARKIDPRGRQVALRLGAGRVAIGVGTLFAPRPALQALGFEYPERSAVAIARLAGGRDLALGALTLAAREDRSTLRTLMLASAALDAADAIALGTATRHKETRRAGLLGLLSGAAAALAGLWAYRRLGG